MFKPVFEAIAAPVLKSRGALLGLAGVVLGIWLLYDLYLGEGLTPRQQRGLGVLAVLAFAAGLGISHWLWPRQGTRGNEGPDAEAATGVSVPETDPQPPKTRSARDASSDPGAPTLASRPATDGAVSNNTRPRPATGGDPYPQPAPDGPITPEREEGGSS